MKVFIIGGTGLIGSETTRELISRGHEIIALALPPLPKGVVLPKAMKLVYGNYLKMTDDALLDLMEGANGFVFAAGIDERVEGPPPIYDLFKRYNIDPLKRLLDLAKRAGIKHTVICGSYFSYFEKKWPHLKLAKNHPYIRSRIDQEEMALSFATEDFNVAILELPYIFGIQPGRKPVWVFLVDIIKKMKGNTYFPKGGTTMVTVKQTAQGICGALEKNQGGNAYPFGYYNMKWKEFFKIVHKAMGYSEKRKVITVPKFLFKIGSIGIDWKRKRNNIEGGLKMSKFVNLQTAKTFIDPSVGAKFLGVQEDNIEEAIIASIKLSVEIIENKDSDVIEMKGE